MLFLKDAVGDALVVAKECVVEIDPVHIDPQKFTAARPLNPRFSYDSAALPMWRDWPGRVAPDAREWPLTR